MRRDTKTIGCFELVSFPDLGIKNDLAKIDTGAFSGAINCSYIKVFRRGVDKKRILRFAIFGQKELFEFDNFEETYIRSATGHRVRRYIIATKVVIQDEIYNIKIGISDRSRMKRNVLIGRRFLRDNNIIVDVRRNSEYDDDGENTNENSDSI